MPTRATQHRSAKHRTCPLPPTACTPSHHPAVPTDTAAYCCGAQLPQSAACRVPRVQPAAAAPSTRLAGPSRGRARVPTPNARPPTSRTEDPTRTISRGYYRILYWRCNLYAINNSSRLQYSANTVRTYKNQLLLGAGSRCVQCVYAILVTTVRCANKNQ